MKKEKDDGKAAVTLFGEARRVDPLAVVGESKESGYMVFGCCETENSSHATLSLVFAREDGNFLIAASRPDGALEVDGGRYFLEACSVFGLSKLIGVWPTPDIARELLLEALKRFEDQTAYFQSLEN